MRFIKRMMAKADISGLNLSLHDYDYCTCRKLANGVISPENAMLTYSILLQTGKDGKYKILQKYDVEELGLQNELKLIDNTINFIDKRIQYLKMYCKTDSKQPDIK